MTSFEEASVEAEQWVYQTPVPRRCASDQQLETTLTTPSKTRQISEVAPEKTSDFTALLASQFIYKSSTISLTVVTDVQWCGFIFFSVCRAPIKFSATTSATYLFKTKLNSCSITLWYHQMSAKNLIWSKGSTQIWAVVCNDDEPLRRNVLISPLCTDKRTWKHHNTMILVRFNAGQSVQRGVSQTEWGRGRQTKVKSER